MHREESQEPCTYLASSPVGDLARTNMLEKLLHAAAVVKGASRGTGTVGRVRKKLEVHFNGAGSFFAALLRSTGPLLLVHVDGSENVGPVVREPSVALSP